MKLLDEVALLEPLPEKGLRRGQVGTVVETLAEGVVEVEFLSEDGHTHALLPLREAQLIVLYRQLGSVA